jgi:hypothetical protein
MSHCLPWILHETSDFSFFFLIQDHCPIQVGDVLSIAHFCMFDGYYRSFVFLIFFLFSDSPIQSRFKFKLVPIL